MGNRFHKLLSVLLAVLFSVPAGAQLFKRAHALYNELPPKAILVELPTEVNRITYFTKKGDSQKAQALAEENSNLIRKTVSDFKDHFKFCPVYFFYDTSIAAVKENNFSRVLLNATLQPAEKIVLSQSDTNFFIVYYGLDITEGDPVSKKNDLYSSDGGSSTVPTLVAMGPGFKKMHSGLPDRVRTNTLKNKRPSNLELSKYAYKSKEFNIIYKPLAFGYSETLTRFYGIRKQ